jgi:hypothetical protein
MSTANFAQSQQQRLFTNSETEQVVQAHVLDPMTGELEDSELETVAGGIQSITVSGPVPDYIANLSRNRDIIATRYANLFRNVG